MSCVVKRFGVLALVATVWGSAGLGAAKPTGKSSKAKTELVLQVKPATAQLFVDAKPLGKATAGRVLEFTPGFHVLRLVNKGDEHEERLKFAPGQRTIYAFDFDEGQPAPEAEGQPGEAPAPEDEGMTRHRNGAGDDK